MPPKGWTSGRPQGIVKAVRLAEDIIERITRYTERLQAELPDIPVNEGVALRRLIRIGLETVERQAPQPQPPASPQEQPAIPLALEPAPTTETQPAALHAPSAPPGMVLCAANPKHRPYSASAQECPMCANNRRTRKTKQRAKQQAQTSS